MSRTPLSRSLNLCAAFADLRKKWIALGPNRTSRGLAALLSERLGRRVTAQLVSIWSTGSDTSHASPPWDVVAALLQELNLVIAIDSTGAFSFYSGRVGFFLSSSSDSAQPSSVILP